MAASIMSNELRERLIAHISTAADGGPGGHVSFHRPFVLTLNVYKPDWTLLESFRMLFDEMSVTTFMKQVKNLTAFLAKHPQSDNIKAGIKLLKP